MLFTVEVIISNFFRICV